MRLMLVLLVAFVLLAAPAQAGTYDVWSCAGPNGEPLPATGWTPESMSGAIASSCGSKSGALSGSLSAGEVPTGSFARWTFAAPKDTTIASVSIQRAAGASGFYLQWYRSYFLFRDSPVPQPGYGLDVCAYLTGPCARPGDPANPWSEASRYSSSSIQAGRLIASIQCDGPASCPAQEEASAGHFKIYRARIGIADAFPPVFRTPVSGPLLDPANTLAGQRTVSFDGSDLGGGLRAAEIVVDGQPVTRTLVAAGGSCREPFNQPVPCPLTATGTIALDSAMLDNGRRRVQVSLVDAAGNRALSDPVVVTVHNDKEPNGVGASRTARLTAAFRGPGRSRRVVRVVGFGRRARVVGRLVDATGKPIGGAELLVSARLDRLGARERLVGKIETRADGRFRWIAPRGPSRFVRIAYRTFKSDLEDAESAEVKLAVRPAIALRVRPSRVRNRGRVTFKGRLLAGPGRAGAQVTIEAVGRDVRKRVPVTTLRADRHGRFRFAYRFLRSFAPFTYRFRARLIRQSSYPYAGGASRVVLVRIVR